MSLVIAAISYSPRSRLHNASISAVLPEPTGPPTPTRRGPFRLLMGISHSDERPARELPSISRLGNKVKARVLDSAATRNFGGEYGQDRSETKERRPLGTSDQQS